MFKLWHWNSNTKTREDMMQRILTFFERYSFGVCTYIGEILNISISKIRLFFIYSSFLAVGFPFIVYFMAAFVLDIRSYVKRIRMKIWDI